MIRRFAFAGCLVLAALAPAAWAPAADKGSEQLLIPLSRPRDPGVLILQHYKGSVTVTGYEGSIVVIEASLPRGGTAAPAEGMRPVATQNLNIHAFEKENVVTVTTNSHERTIDLDIRVPSAFSLEIDKRDEGTVTAYYLRGEMNISSAVSDISLFGIDGSGVVSAVDGGVTAVFRGVNPRAPMSFTSVAGNIAVTFPPDLSAVLKMRTDRGSISSDFDIAVEKRRAEADTSRVSGVRRASLDRWTYGTVGAGGPQYVFQSYRGNIEIRKARDQSNVAP